MTKNFVDRDPLGLRHRESSVKPLEKGALQRMMYAQIAASARLPGLPRLCKVRADPGPLGDLVRQSDRITGFGSLDIKASMINHNFLDTVKQGLRDAGFDLAEVGVSSVRM